MVSYEPLRLLFVKEKKNGYDINMREMIDNKVVTPNVSVKLNNDRGYVNLSTIDAVCNYLTIRLGRTVTIDEVVEFVPDEPIQEQQPTDNQTTDLTIEARS